MDGRDTLVFDLYPQQLKKISGIRTEFTAFNYILIQNRLIFIEKCTNDMSMWHTFVMLIFNNDVELVTLQELMGQTDLQATLRYAWIIEERKRELLRRYLVK